MHGQRKFSWLTLTAVGYLITTILSGCGGGTSTPPLEISVSFSGGNSKTIEQGQFVTITAVVSNDSSAKGVTWTLSGPGAFSKQASTSVEYDAPASVASNMIATVTATAVADPSKSAVYTVTVTPPPSPALVKLSTDPLTNSTSQHPTEVDP